MTSAGEGWHESTSPGSSSFASQQLAGKALPGTFPAAAPQPRSQRSNKRVCVNKPANQVKVQQRTECIKSGRF